MRTLLTSFSLAALFSLVTACAVDPDSVETDNLETSDDIAINHENLDEAAELPSRDNLAHPTREIEGPGLEKLEQPEQPYCEQNYDCESKSCDQSLNRCRDYPF